jgi:hypothetical protein
MVAADEARAPRSRMAGLLLSVGEAAVIRAVPRTIPTRPLRVRAWGPSQLALAQGKQAPRSCFPRNPGAAAPTAGCTSHTRSRCFGVERCGRRAAARGHFGQPSEDDVRPGRPPPGGGSDALRTARPSPRWRPLSHSLVTRCHPCERPIGVGVTKAAAAALERKEGEMSVMLHGYSSELRPRATELAGPRCLQRFAGLFSREG